MRNSCFLALLSAAAAVPPARGPFATNATIYSVGTLDSSDPRAWAWFPANASAGAKFPLVPYLHGIFSVDLIGYTNLFSQIASYGFVVVAPFSCNLGCADAHAARDSRYTECGGQLPLAPLNMGWDAYYGEAFKLIEWAANHSQSADPFFSLIDYAAGAGIAGHSMGGQGAAMAAARGCPARWNVKTAVLHHPANGDVPAGNIGSNMTIPVAAFTSSGDGVWWEARDYMAAFNQSRAGLPSAYRYEVGWSHLEPMLWPPCENPLLATYTAAWLKVFLSGDRGEYYDLIYGSGPDSLCRHAPMVECSVVGAPK